MSVAEILEAIRRLPAAERRELVEHIWLAWPKPEGVSAWQPLKTEIDALLSSADQLERAHHVLRNIQVPGSDPEPTPEPVPAPELIAEPESRAEDTLNEIRLEKAEPGKPFAEVLDEINKRFPAP